MNLRFLTARELTKEFQKTKGTPLQEAVRREFLRRKIPPSYPKKAKKTTNNRQEKLF